MSSVYKQAPHIHLAQITPAQAMPDFAKLLGTKAWGRLHPAICRRFSGHDLRVSYTGTIEIKSHFVGTFFTCLLLPFGRPLPLMKAGAYATCVNVFPNNRGIVWQRDFLR